ncbi:MAG TPA: hypothetical protein VJ964_11250 [Balneolaceae bacterium]|nr:hypothetical protein [Balneolaceae bacterium]
MMLETSEIIDLRSAKNEVHPERPYHFMHEQERGADGELKEVNAIFLTNSECPFKCVMCDLWKNTLKNPVNRGDIPKQIDYALNHLPKGDVVKLYNSGNFFDRKAIPPEDYQSIAKRLYDYEQVIIENHPKLCDKSCAEFQNMLNGNLEIAMGLETIHPEVLPKLNKQITKDDFKEAASFLRDHGISSRAFLLLNPPYLTDPDENIEWTIRSVEFAFDCGVSACSIIPTRDGNGAMEKLHEKGQYLPPAIGALEKAFEQALNLNSGRIFVDLWDLKRFSTCTHCFNKRKDRLHQMNLDQKIRPGIKCDYCGDE